MNISELVKTDLPFDSIKNAVEEIVKKDFVKYDIKVLAGSKPGDNIMSIVYRVVITGTLKNGGLFKHHLFCKLAPVNEERRQQYRARECFLRESEMLTDILQQFKMLQDAKGILEDPFESFMKYHTVSTERQKEFIIMEDLQDRDYIMLDKRVPIGFDHVKLVMKELGKLHAFSFAIRDQKPEIFERYKVIKEIWIKDGEEAPPGNKEYFSELFDKAMDTLGEHEDECREKFKKFEHDFHKFDYNTKGELVEPYAVITHGDCWTNNMLFKYKDEIPEKVTFIDWQLSRYTSPILDLSYYVFCCLDKSIRDAHYEDMLNVYHESFSRFLRRLGSDPAALFPYSIFREHLLHLGNSGLVLAIMTMSNFVTETTDILEDNEIKNESNSDQTHQKYKIRMVDVIRDMVRLGYI